jgi:hypothetical protein
LVGIFLTTFNLWEQTQRCLESFRRCTEGRCRLLILDNCSDDGTPQRLREMGHEVWISPERVSLPRAMNLGTAAFMDDPEVEYIGWIENDMILLPRWLDNLVAVLREHPEIGKLGATHLTGEVPDDGEVLARIERERNWLRLGNAIPWLMPKWAVAEVGPHDEGFVHGGAYEDWDYNNRLLERGIPVMVTRRSLVWHGCNATTRGALQPVGAEEQNRAYYSRKWGHLHWGWCHPGAALERRLW